MDVKIPLNKKLCNLLDYDKLCFIETLAKVSMMRNDQEIIVQGTNKNTVAKMINLIDTQISGNNISCDEIRALYVMATKESRRIRLQGLNKEIVPRSDAQSQYINLINTKDIIFAAGLAGTGKTHIAAAFGLNALMLHKVNKLILSRPVVEAGEKLGFLPGDLKDKIDPYLRPLYDELLIWIEQDLLERYIAQGKIEIAPLAYMRGRTFRNAWIILDEAQNTTINQMKMFLTRFGIGSKMVITGDESQIDLTNRARSGLADAISRLNSIDEIGCIRFNHDSIVRHPLLHKVLDAYEK